MASLKNFHIINTVIKRSQTLKNLISDDLGHGINNAIIPIGLIAEFHTRKCSLSILERPHEKRPCAKRWSLIVFNVTMRS